MPQTIQVGPAVLNIGGTAAAPSTPPQIRGRAHLTGADSPLAPEHLSAPREGFPLLATPGPASASCEQWADVSRQLLDERLEQSGAVLLRGLPLASPQDFSKFMVRLGYAPMDYKGGAAVRTSISDNVTTVNNLSGDVTIQMHTELSYSAEFPRRVFLFCEIPPTPGEGGETPIARTADWREALGPEIFNRFVERGLCRRATYISQEHSTDPTINTWQVNFQTQDRAEAEAICVKRGYKFEWVKDNSLAMWSQLSVTQPLSGKDYWTCVPQFSAPASSSEYRYGDGEPIEPEVMEKIRATQWNLAVAFAWQAGDVLCVDNITCQHGRLSFAVQSKRAIYAALTECTRRPPIDR